MALRSLLVLVTCAAVGAVVAGCGSSQAVVRHPTALVGGHGDNGPSFDYPRRATVVVDDAGFHPRRLRIAINTTVSFVNRGRHPHSVRWTSGGGSPRFVSRPLQPGAAFEIRFSRVAPHVVYQSGGEPSGGGWSGIIEVH